MQVKIELPGWYRQGTAIAELVADPPVQLERFQVRYTNAEVSFDGRTVRIGNQFPDPRSSDQIRDWAIAATTQFGHLLSFWIGVHIEATRIRWTLEDPSSGVSVEYGLEARTQRLTVRPSKEPLDRMAAYLSWVGDSYYLAFAVMAYHSALDSADPTTQLTHLYRTLEILEHTFGGEKRFVEFLGSRGIAKTRYKRAKRLINEGGYFIRHAPRGGRRIRPIPDFEVDECWSIAQDVLRLCLEHEHQERIRQNGGVISR